VILICFVFMGSTVMDGWDCGPILCEISNAGFHQRCGHGVQKWDDRPLRLDETTLQIPLRTECLSQRTRRVNIPLGPVNQNIWLIVPCRFCWLPVARLISNSVSVTLLNCPAFAKHFGCPVAHPTSKNQTSRQQTDFDHHPSLQREGNVEAVLQRLAGQIYMPPSLRVNDGSFSGNDGNFSPPSRKTFGNGNSHL